MGTVLGLDWGERRLGVAVADETGGPAVPLTTIVWTGRRDLKAQLEAVVAERDPVRFVVGWPLRLDGTPGQTCAKVEAFIGRLRGWFGLPVHRQDERLTSAQVRRTGRSTGTGNAAARRKGIDDRAAAVLLLQAWLDRERGGSPDPAVDPKEAPSA
jgi:putative Holliday junction resolvase